MSYARWKEGVSDVYVYFHLTFEEYVCHGCTLEPSDGMWMVKTPLEMIEHLRRHEASGHKIPESAILSLEIEAAA